MNDLLHAPLRSWAALDPAVRWMIVGIFAVLLVAEAAVRLLRRMRPASDRTELRQRVTSWWVMAGVFTVAIVLNRVVSILFFSFVSFLALKEYFSLVPTRRADRRVLFWAYLCIPIQFLLVDREWFGMFIIFIPVFAFLLVPFRMITIGQTDGYLKAVGTIHWGLMTMVFSLSHAAFLLILRLDGRAVGPGLVLYLVVLTQANDVFQYLWGKSVGKRKVLPKVSPGKTWGGFLGGRRHDRAAGDADRPLHDADGHAAIAGGWVHHRPGRVRGGRQRLRVEARLAGQGQRQPAAGPRRHPRPRRQPDLHGAAVLPLRLLLVRVPYVRGGAAGVVRLTGVW